ncbi:hypothetical protein FCIRC_2956 [Fusarium circinatum]|uniref:RanBP2-type domain-containing protein n=1 Tax=Fusarium circinatum TaxID=48490 RepID=A0A8H5X8D2_FUSCI|nr:hypothetical protein FCIRC_2956 [Fusarium circinatum]
MLDYEQRARNYSPTIHKSPKLPQLATQGIKHSKSHKHNNTQLSFTSTKMSKPTEVNISYWLCMNVTCTKLNNIDRKRCKECDAELAKGAKALDADIDDIGECEGIDSNGKPVWKLHQAKTVDLWDARAESTYGWD